MLTANTAPQYPFLPFSLHERLPYSVWHLVHKITHFYE